MHFTHHIVIYGVSDCAYRAEGLNVSSYVKYTTKIPLFDRKTTSHPFRYYAFKLKTSL